MGRLFSNTLTYQVEFLPFQYYKALERKLIAQEYCKLYRTRSHKVPAVQTPTSHPQNYPNKSCRILLEKYGWAHKQSMPVDRPPSHRQARLGRPARTNLHQLCTGTGCSMEDLPKAIADRDEWRERVREIRASGSPW